MTTEAQRTNPSSCGQLAEDVADLTAIVRKLETRIEITQQLAEGRTNTVGKSDGASAEVADEQHPPSPPLILLLSGEQYDQELAALAIWVEYVLVPAFLNEVSSSAPWCECWWEHLPAVARLHALWLAWQELTTPEAGGYTGPSVWMRDHLRPTMEELRSPQGPFAACATKPGSANHTLLRQPAVQPFPQRQPSI